MACLRFLLMLPFVFAALAGCGSSHQKANARVSTSHLKPAKNYKIGKPYKIFGKWYYPKVDYNYQEHGMASWYGDCDHGKPTANGERFNHHAMTAAHRTLPIPCMVQVTRKDTGKSIIVRVNDRGPFARNRIIDLSKGAARKLDMLSCGHAPVHVKILSHESRILAGDHNSKIRPKTPQRSIPVIRAPEVTNPHNYGRYLIQVGAFGSQENAESLRHKLSSLGSCSILPTWVDGRKLYRVRLGPFQNESGADKVLADVAKRGYPEAAIILD